MKKKTKIIIAIAALACLLLAIRLIWFGDNNQITYLTESARRGDIVQVVNATGEVTPLQLVNVGAQVSGQIEKLHVRLGQEVQKGDMIAEIDSTTQLNELNINKAKLDTYKAQLNSKQITLNVAQKQYDREKALFAKEATSRENLENAEDAYAAAKAAVNELESLIKQTQIAVNTSEVNLGYTKISAPLNGTVVSVHVEEGQTVNANQTTPTIVQIADLNSMLINLEISEGDISRVKPGMVVEYSILGEPGMVFSTSLQSIDPGLTTLTDKNYDQSGSTDTSNSAVYYYGKLVVDNQERHLRIGMTVQSTITIAQARDVLILPSIAIENRGGSHFVRVLGKNKQVEERQVETGLSDNMNTQIISGLKEGEVAISAQMSAGEVLNSSNTRVRMPISR